MDPTCYECSLSYREPGPADLVMFLHALRYTVSTIFFFKNAILKKRHFEERNRHFEFSCLIRSISSVPFKAIGIA